MCCRQFHQNIRTVTLPTASDNKGRVIEIVNNGQKLTVEVPDTLHVVFEARKPKPWRIECQH